MRLFSALLRTKHALSLSLSLSLSRSLYLPADLSTSCLSGRHGARCRCRSWLLWLLFPLLDGFTYVVLGHLVFLHKRCYEREARNQPLLKVGVCRYYPQSPLTHCQHSNRGCTVRFSSIAVPRRLYLSRLPRLTCLAITTGRTPIAFHNGLPGRTWSDVRLATIRFFCLAGVFAAGDVACAFRETPAYSVLAARHRENN